MSPELNDPRFVLRSTGRFMDRDGPHGRQAPRSRKKLCIVATDVALLIDMLYGLSLRSDCAFVKYGTYVRDGMYLGRVFLATDFAALELCEALKGHARLLVTVQDDETFDPFRVTPPGPSEHGIYEDWSEHAATVAEIHTQAFGRPEEAAMVAQVVASGAPTISLVGAIDNVIAGHVLLSPVTLEHREEPRGLGLAPLAVRPSHQHRGLGSGLVRDALRRAQLFGYAYAVVLGDPTYYARFGFTPASRFGLRYEARVPDEAFMALPLQPDALASATGVVRYLPAFSPRSEM